MKLKNPLHVEGFLLYIVSMIRNIIFIFLSLISPILLAQPSIDSLLIKREIVQMLHIDSTVKSGGAMSSLIGFSERDIREIPGEILVITAEDIEAMGATDLMDVIIYLTSTSLGRDVEDALGIGVRGLWAQEGKVLFMFNGIPLNDLDYGTYLLGGRLPLHMVSRIEFSFGPGSVKYGGTAALGVINVVLKSNAEFSGGAIKSDLSFSNGQVDRSFIGFVGNYELNDNYKVSIQVNSGKMKKSTRVQQLFRNRQLNWGDSSEVNCNNVFIGLNKGKYRGAFYYSDFQSQISDEPQLVLMSTVGLDNSLSFKLSDRTKMEVQFTYMDQLPWIDLNTTDSTLIGSNTHAQRINQNIIFKSKFSKNIDLDYGVQGVWQQSRILLRSAVFDYNDLNQMRVGAGAIFFDGFYRGKLGSLSVGYRMESHTFSKLLFAPRVGYAVQFQKFHFKAFAAQAFKIATIQNQNGALLTQQLKNETVVTYELEMGINMNYFNWKASAFKIGIANPILYVYDQELGIDNYINRPTIGTEGIQSLIRWNKNNFRVTMSGSLQRTIDHALIAEVQNEDGEIYFGFPSYKLNFFGSYRFLKNYSFSFGGMKQSEINVYNAPQLNNGILLHFGIGGQFLKSRNLHFNLFVKNALNSEFGVASATDLEIDPLPLLSRQIQCSVQYHFY